ncbi:response regulator [uncultured Maricaulis sp.]|uniref:response regulator n=1 Tax=uncultured Maricaulis sp. TaxID=174710 RepID=UPI0030D9E133|tara:strand:+ start:92359 stop:92793 length:435 start_codon:yes stop_codon:yes gene_type:complete
MSALDLSGVTLLLIDDSRSVRTVLKTLLCGLGISRIYECRDPDDALVVARLSRPDLALVDYDLGLTSGLDLIRRFRDSQVSANPDMPMILLAPPSLPHFVRDAEAAGADAVLPKPVNAGTLGQKIGQVLQSATRGGAVQSRHSA